MKTLLLIALILLIPIAFIALLFTTSFFKGFNKINHD